MPISSPSLAKALAVRMPEMLDSIWALMPACRALTSMEARLMLRRRCITKAMPRGRIRATIRVSRHSMRNMMIKAPMMVTVARNISSGP